MGRELNCYFWGAGTTSLTNRLAGKEFHAPQPTVGVNCAVVKTDPIKLTLWDTSSDPRFESTMRGYAQKANIGIYCVDLSKEIDEKKIKEDIEWFRKYNKDQARILVVGTKSDLSTQSDKNLQQVINKLFTKPSEQPAVFITSAKTDQGIEEFKKDLISERPTVSITSAKTDQSINKEAFWNDLISRPFLNAFLIASMRPSERPKVSITSAKTDQGIEDLKKDLISEEALYKEIEKPALKLIHALAKMRDYGKKLEKEDVDKSNTILTLHTKLCRRLGLEDNRLDGSHVEIEAIKNAFKNAFKNERDTQSFQYDFKKLLHSEDGNMSRHRKVWKPIVANIMLALTGVGAAIMAARAAGHLVHSLATRKSPSLRATFFFTDTNSMKNINSVEEALDDLVKKGPNK